VGKRGGVRSETPQHHTEIIPHAHDPRYFGEV
jgi:hypothetical protein